MRIFRQGFTTLYGFYVRFQEKQVIYGIKIFIYTNSNQWEQEYKGEKRKKGEEEGRKGRRGEGGTFHFRISLLDVIYQLSGTNGSNPLCSAYAMKQALFNLSPFHFSFTFLNKKNQRGIWRDTLQVWENIIVDPFLICLQILANGC